MVSRKAAERMICQSHPPQLQSRERDVQRAMARRAPWSPANAQLKSIGFRNMGLENFWVLELTAGHRELEMWQESQNKIAQLSQQAEWMIIKQYTSSTKVISSVLASIRLIVSIRWNFHGMKAREE